ncbi:hypothetical protein [Actinoplanes subtropicus]|uniref:hypothetical protein n=1 Tax=Actinoplanes subtropicus TaxID=543632 RepID=UPI000B02064E|nr:hypothetical protein [Actinoplanes subtropicus]
MPEAMTGHADGGDTFGGHGGGVVQEEVVVAELTGRGKSAAVDGAELVQVAQVDDRPP